MRRIVQRMTVIIDWLLNKIRGGRHASTVTPVKCPALSALLLPLLGYIQTNDILYNGYNRYVEWVAGLQPGTVALVFRLALMFAFSCAICWYMFYLRCRIVFIQVLQFALSVLIAWGIPLFVPRDPHLTALFLIISFVILAFIPAIAPFFITPYYGIQRFLRWMFYSLIFGLLIMNLFR